MAHQLVSTNREHFIREKIKPFEILVLVRNIQRIINKL